MATPTLNNGAELVSIDVCDSLTNWNQGVGSTAKPELTSDSYVEGGTAVGFEQKTTGVNGGYVDGTTWDFSSSLVWFWINITAAATLLAKASGGVRIYAYDGTNTAYWYIGGNDADWCYGGWKRLAIDLNRTPDSGTAPTLTNITRIGVDIQDNGTTLGKALGLYIDTMHYGNFLEVYGGTSGDPVTLQDIVDADTNVYGLVTKNKNGVFEVAGGLVCGDVSGANDTVVSLQNTVIVVPDNPVAAASNFIRPTDDTGTTSLLLGTSSGTGDDEVGFDGSVIFLENAEWGNGYRLDFDEAVDELEIFGSTFIRVLEGIDLAVDTSHLFKNNTVVGSGQVTCGTTVVRNCFFNGTEFGGLETFPGIGRDPYGVLSHDVSAAAPAGWTDETADATDAGADDVGLMPTPTGADHLYIGWINKFDLARFIVSTAGVGTYTLSWSYWNGTTWSSLTVTDGTGNFKTVGTFDVTFTIPSDWETTTVYNRGPYYFIRATSDGGTQTTQPLGQRIRTQTDSPCGSALLWNASINIKNCSFLANTDDDNDPHAIEHDTAGTFTYDNLQFGGNDFDIENSALATTVDNYPSYNQDSSLALNGTNTAVGQEFNNATSGTLSRAGFFLQKVLSPTGTAYAKLYASDGAATAEPTGSVLATSTGVDVSTLQTTYNWVEFEFRDEYTLAATTDYFIVLEYADGDGSNYVNAGYDGSVPSHGGNRATYTSGSWTGSADDLCFKVNKDGIVKVQTQNGSNPGTGRCTASVRGAVIIENSVTVTVGGMTEGAAVKILADETVGTITKGDVLLEDYADSDGDAELIINYESAFDPTGLDIIIRAAQQGLPAAAIAEDDTAYTDETLAANSSTTDDMTLLPSTPVATEDAYILGAGEQFNRLKLDISNVATGATIVWQYWNGAWTSLSGVSDGTSSFSESGENVVSWTLPGDWAKTTINGQGPFYFVRAYLSAGTPDQALAKKCQLDITRYRAQQQNNTITSSGLTTTMPWVEDTVSQFLPTD